VAGPTPIDQGRHGYRPSCVEDERGKHQQLRRSADRHHPIGIHQLDGWISTMPRPHRRYALKVDATTTTADDFARRIVAHR
jgi:chloramphenicol 3-O-phosphotransferase